jgi:hypothetical protein
MNLLALLVCVPLALTGDRILPSLDCATKSSAEWMQVFESSEPKTAEPLWCLYWSDARSDEVIAFMNKWRTRLPDKRPVLDHYPRPRNLGREIEEILTQWGVEHAPLAPQWCAATDGKVLTELPENLAFFAENYSHPTSPDHRWYQAPSGLYSLPMALSPDSDAALVAALESEDRVEHAQAAMTLIARRSEVPRALHSLIARVVRDREQGVLVNTGGGFYTDEGQDTFAVSNRSWHDRGPTNVRVFQLEHLSAYVLDWATGVLGTAGARIVATEIAKGKERGREIQRAFDQPTNTYWAQFSPAACEIIRFARDGELPHEDQQPKTIAPPGFQPLRSVPASTWFNSSAPRVGSSAPTKPPPAGSERGHRVGALGNELRKRLADGQPSDDVMRELLSLLRIPYGDTPNGGFEDWYTQAFYIFENPACVTQDVIDWCLSILCDESHWNRHVRSAIEVLESCDLTLRQRAIAVQSSDIMIGRPMTSFFIRQGGVSIERAARWRTYAQAWEDIEMLGDVLKVSRPSSQDIEMLQAALDRGFAQDRATAIAILKEHPELDSAPFKASVVRACEDCDDLVRDAARALRKDRGW